MNCEAFSSFVGVSSDHRIVTAKIRLSLRKNATRTTNTIPYDWALLNNKDIRDKYVIALRNKFDALQEKAETRTLNDEYENFVNAHLEAAAKYIPTKHRTKSRVPWETLAVREKHADVKIASKCNKKNPTNANDLKLKKTQKELASMYLKEQTEYIQNTTCKKYSKDRYYTHACRSKRLLVTVAGPHILTTLAYVSTLPTPCVDSTPLQRM